MSKRLLAVLAVTLLAAGCSDLRSVTSDVTSFGEWPADRKPGTYAFDRLPSQQAQAAETQKLEDAARPALEKAGFTPEFGEVTMKPLNEAELTGDDAVRMQKLLDALESLDDVQAVYTSAVMDDA